MKKLNFYDQLNSAALLLVSPEWRKVKAARKSAVSFETPDVTIPTETRTIASRNIRFAEAGPLIAFSSKLGAIRHRANAKQIDDYKRAYSGRAAKQVTNSA